MSSFEVLVTFQSFISLDVFLFIWLYLLFTLGQACPSSILHVGCSYPNGTDPLTSWCKGGLSLLLGHSGLRSLWLPWECAIGQRDPIREREKQCSVIQSFSLHTVCGQKDTVSSMPASEVLYRAHWYPRGWMQQLKISLFRSSKRRGQCNVTWQMKRSAGDSY